MFAARALRHRILSSILAQGNALHETAFREAGQIRPKDHSTVRLAPRGGLFHIPELTELDGQRYAAGPPSERKTEPGLGGSASLPSAAEGGHSVGTPA